MSLSDLTSRLDVEEWSDALAAPVARVFGRRASADSITLLCLPKPVADDTTKLLVSDPDGRPIGVFLCSEYTAPGMVARNMERTREARKALGPILGRQLLEPLLEGQVHGLTYALLPYCHPVGHTRLRSRADQLALTPSILDWLRLAMRATVSPPSGADAEFAESLEHLAEFPGMPKRVRMVATRALDRLADGTWTPRRVLMHGDFWWGNILTHSPETADPMPRLPWDRFVIIDWAGSRTDGFAIFDLVRLAQTARVSDRRLAAEVSAHCSILGCDPCDALSYLAAATGNLGLNLEHFPPARYVALVDSCMKSLQGLVPRQSRPRSWAPIVKEEQTRPAPGASWFSEETVHVH